MTLLKKTEKTIIKITVVIITIELINALPESEARTAVTNELKEMPAPKSERVSNKP